MDIWNLHATSTTTLRLWRTSDNQFRVVEQGQQLPLLTNPDYILIHKKYRPIIDKLIGQITFRPVTIVDEVQQLTFDNFLELTLQIELQPGKNDSDRGLKVWKYSDEYIFVTTELKNELQKMADNELGFTVGFSHFAGTETGSR